MKISESFSYQFEDLQWPTKLGLGALISLVPVLNFALAGYEVAIIRNVAAGDAEPLPHWDDLGQKFLDGLILWLAGLIYAAPIIILVCLPLGVLAASGMLSQYRNTEALGRPIAGAGIVLLACFLAILIAYSLLLSLIRPVILVIFSRDGTFSSCFRLGEIVRLINRQPGNFATIWLVVIAAGLVIGLIVGFITAIVGWIPCLGWAAGALLTLGSAIYLITVDGYLFGQFRLAVLGPAAPRAALPAAQA